MRKQTAIWKTRDGKEIRVCDMTDSHLKNTIAFLERMVHSQEWEVAYALESMFEKAQDDDLIVQVESPYHECSMPPIYEKMLLEEERRNECDYGGRVPNKNE